MWVRGLKHLSIYLDFYENVVAPYVGAWIETPQYGDVAKVDARRTLCGCVD